MGCHWHVRTCQWHPTTGNNGLATMATMGSETSLQNWVHSTEPSKNVSPQARAIRPGDPPIKVLSSLKPGSHESINPGPQLIKIGSHRLIEAPFKVNYWSPVHIDNFSPVHIIYLTLVMSNKRVIGFPVGLKNVSWRWDSRIERPLDWKDKKHGSLTRHWLGSKSNAIDLGGGTSPDYLEN